LPVTFTHCHSDEEIAMPRLVRAVLPLAFLAACQPATTELTEQRKAEIADQISQVLNDYAGFVRQRDQDGVMGLYEQSTDLAFAAYGEITLSWDAMADVVRQSWQRFVSVESMEWGDLHIQVLAPNVAAVTTTFDYAATDTAGAAFTLSGTFSMVWLQSEGEWKIINVAETFPPPVTANEGT